MKDEKNFRYFILEGSKNDVIYKTFKKMTNRPLESKPMALFIRHNSIFKSFQTMSSTWPW